MPERVAAGFALGALLDNADRCDEAFPAFAQANAHHRRYRIEAGEWFDAEVFRREVDTVIERASPAFFSRAAGWGNRLGAAGLYRRYAALGYHPGRTDRGKPFASVWRRRAARDRHHRTRIRRA